MVESGVQLNFIFKTGYLLGVGVLFDYLTRILYVRLSVLNFTNKTPCTSSYWILDTEILYNIYKL